MTKLFLTISILVLTINLYGQDNSITNTNGSSQSVAVDKEFELGSNIVFPVLNDSLIQDLACLGRVWGFLKYHHPKVARGEYNWDFELFRFLPGFLEVKNHNAREGLMLEWINSLGDISKTRKAKGKSKKSFAKSDLNWIDSLIADKSLKEKLYQVYERRNQGEHFYVGSDPETPTFLNEESYPAMPFPDEGFRLLALYRYWNIIHYYFPYKHLTDKEWDTVLVEYIPYFLQAKDELDYELIILKIVGEIHDSHANIWDGGNKLYYKKGEYYPPFHVRYIENQLIVDDYFNLDKMELAGVKIGDIITHINGKQVTEIVDSLLIYCPASNISTKLRDLSYDILRSPNNEIEITYLSSNLSQTVKLTLYKMQDLNWYNWYPLKKEKGFKLLTSDILYLNMSLLDENDTPAIAEHLAKVESVIIDVRNYPNLMAMYSVLPYLQTTKKPFAVFTDRNINNPGEFYWTKNFRIYGNKNPFTGKVVVLSNELTQSLGEFAVMAVMATGNVTSIGSQTAGADGRIAFFYLPGGIKTSITGRGVYYPDKSETQRIGIVPDIEVKPTIKGIQEGRDEVIERAMEILEN